MNLLKIILNNEYFYLRQRVPIFIYIIYIHFKNRSNQGIEKIMNWSLKFIGALTLYAFIGLIMDIPFKKFIPLNWRYSGLITWGIFFLGYYYLSLKKVNNKLQSFTLASLATIGGGWLYEIPFFNPLNMFIHHFAIFYLDTQFICLLLLGYEFKKLNFKPNRNFYGALALYMAFSIILYWDPLFFIEYLWVYRIPTCIFLLSLIGGIEK